MRWMLLKPLSKLHYEKARQDIITETGDPEAATAEAIFERGNKTVAENVEQYDNRPRKIPRICGRLATGRAFSLRQVVQPRKKSKKAERVIAYNRYEEELVPLFLTPEAYAAGDEAAVSRTQHNVAKRMRRARRAH